MHLQHDSLPFLPLERVFRQLISGERKILNEKATVTNAFRLFEFWIFFRRSFFSYSFLFAAVIDLTLGLLAVKKLLRERQRDGQFLPWSGQV